MSDTPASSNLAGINAMPRIVMGESSSTGRWNRGQDESARAEIGYTLRDIFALFRRRKGLILGCVTAFTVLSAVIATVLTPRYVAEALVILDTRQQEVVQQGAVLSNLVSGSQADPAIVRTEVALISSPAYAHKIIERLDLLHNPDFQNEENAAGFLDQFQGVVDFLNRKISFLTGQRPSNDVGTPMDRAIAALGRQLTVYNDERSYAIRLRYDSRYPALATTIANTVAMIYISDQLDFKRDATHRASTWLKGELGTLRTKVRVSERKVADYEKTHHLETVLSGNVTEQRLHDLNMQLMVAAGDRAQKQATLEQVQTMMRSPEGATAASQVLSSPLIQKLREEEALASGRVASYRESYKSASPHGQALVSEIEQKIAAEVQRISLGLAGEVSAERAREKTLQDAITQQQTDLDAIGGARVELVDLQHEALTNRNLYDHLLLRSQQVEADEQSLQSGARVVPAEKPLVPSFPNKPLVIGFGFFGSLFLSILFAFVVERSDETIRTPEQAEQLTGVPSLGMLPRVRNGKLALAGIMNAPFSPYPQAISNILVALSANGTDGGHRIIAVTSALPREGKTLFATSLARAAATTRTRTLLIDCDMRRPSVGQLLGGTSPAMLQPMFEQKSANFSKFSMTDSQSGLNYIPTGQTMSNPQQILGSEWMTELLAQARQEYDLVILDAPPLLAAADALLLSRMADLTLLMVRWGRTPIGSVSAALRLLQLHGGGRVGTILSLVDLRRSKQYHSHGSNYSMLTR